LTFASAVALLTITLSPVGASAATVSAEDATPTPSPTATSAPEPSADPEPEPEPEPETTTSEPETPAPSTDEPSASRPFVPDAAPGLRTEDPDYLGTPITADYEDATTKRVEPDQAYDTDGGQRVEIYTSVGDNTGVKFDWRQTNEYAYLVSSVPKGKQLYTTAYNTLWDGDSAKRNPATNKWEMRTSSNQVRTDDMFIPSIAFLKQVNQYDTQAERLQYLHVLGNQYTVDEALSKDNPGSGLASLLKAGYKSSGDQALDYTDCNFGGGACFNVAGSSGTIMHSKYAAFEQARDSTGTIRDNVIWITSANLNGSSGGKKSNVSIAIFDDKAAYDGIVKTIWNAQVTHTFTSAFRAAMANGITTDSGVVLYPSPRSTRATTTDEQIAAVDVEAKFLQQAAQSGTKRDCKVYAIHSLFSTSRSGILSGMNGLENQGCDVKVVLGTNALTDIVDAYFSMSTDLRNTIDRVEFANVHDKTMSVSYTRGNGQRSQSTFGGSANFNSTSLDYDELSWRGDDPAITEAVQRHSERIYQLAKGSLKAPKSFRIVPDGTSQVVQGESLQLATRVAPLDAVTPPLTWTSSNTAVATVDATGKVRAKSVTARTYVTIKADAMYSPAGSDSVTIVVVPSGSTSEPAPEDFQVTTPPVLTMDNYQPPSSDGYSTNVVVTWGQGDKDYTGVVKLQYYSKGRWVTYGGKNEWVMVKNGIGRASYSFKSSHAWRAYGARVDSADGSQINVAAIDKRSRYTTGYSLNTVRTTTSTMTPRLYATNYAKSGDTVPFLLTWATGGSSTVRLQYLSGSRWKTYGSYEISGADSQMLIGTPVKSTHRWRLATSPKGSRAVQVSKSINVIMKSSF
jgi:uncharacterized protein YjdB